MHSESFQLLLRLLSDLDEIYYGGLIFGKKKKEKNKDNKFEMAAAIFYRLSQHYFAGFMSF